MNYWIMGLVGVSIIVTATSVVVSVVALVQFVMPEKVR